jgi:hypothetical protein
VSLMQRRGAKTSNVCVAKCVVGLLSWYVMVGSKYHPTCASRSPQRIIAGNMGTTLNGDVKGGSGLLQCLGVIRGSRPASRSRGVSTSRPEGQKGSASTA